MDIAGSSYKEWINLSRGIGMLLVVMGHAIADSFSINEGIAYYVFHFIYSFHMPLFFFLSGYCARKIFELDCWKKRGMYVVKRFFRLMVPYFVVAFIYVPLDYFLARFTSGVSDGNVFLNLIKGDNPDYQLWVLYALFLMALFTTIFNRLPLWFFAVISLCCFAINEFITTDLAIVSSFGQQYIFFVLGFIVRKKQIEIQQKKVVSTTIAAIIFVSSYLLRSVFNIENGETDFLFLITGCSGIYLSIVAAKLLSSKTNFSNKLFNLIGKYSMDIYIMGNLPQVAVRVLCFSLLLLPGIVGCVLSVVMGILLPILVSKLIVRRFKLIKGLILGNW